MGFIKKHSALLIALIVYWGISVMLLRNSLRLTGGHLVYEVDDAYIHMAIARNVVLHGNWGINTSGFSSTSSSPLWTVLLAVIYYLFGAHELTLLILNALLSSLLILIMYLLLQRQTASKPALLALLLVNVVLLAPLPELTLAGMEHILHALLAILFAHQVSWFISQPYHAPLKQQAQLALLALLLAGIRYEGLFIVLPALVLLFLRRRWKTGIFIACCSILPMVTLGVWSLSNGWYFLPNALLLKPPLPPLTLGGIIAYLFSLLEYPLYNSQITALLIMIVLLLVRLGLHIPLDYKRSLLFIVIAGILCQFILKIGWFYRYHSYLIVLGLFAIGAVLLSQSPTRSSRFSILSPAKQYSGNIARIFTTVILVILLASPLAIHAAASIVRTPLATQNTYEHEYQMARFLQKYYSGKTIAATDIGAIAYYANVFLVDLWGLGTLESAKLKRASVYTTQDIARIARQNDAAIALVYDKWFEEYGGVPPEWQKAGEWTVEENIILKDNTLSFYALHPEEWQNLVKNLRSFSSELSPTTKQSGAFLLSETLQ